MARSKFHRHSGNLICSRREGNPTSRASGSLPGLVLHLLGPLLHDLVLHAPCHHHWSCCPQPDPQSYSQLACHRHASNYHYCQSSDRSSPGLFRLFGSKAFYDSRCSGDLPPGALCPACRAAYCTTCLSYRFPSSTAYLARRSAADPPGLTSRPTTRSSCTAPCLPLFTGHVFLLDDDV